MTLTRRVVAIACVLLVISAPAVLRAVVRLASTPAAASALPAREATPPRTPPSPRAIRRTVLAVWDSRYEHEPRRTSIHNLAELPLNHLGLVVRYHDLRSGLPAPDAVDDVRGILSWFSGDAVPDPVAYWDWIDRFAASGRPVVILGALGTKDDAGTAVPMAQVNRVLAGLGWRLDGGWLTTTMGTTYGLDGTGLVGFERRLPVVVPPYAVVRATAPDARVALRVRRPGRPADDSDLIIVTPRGAYVAPGYAYFTDRDGAREFRQWYVDPFELFRLAFATDALPKPDTTTLSGRRIYYSHIDGDGWRNLTQIEPHRTRYVIAARVVLDELIRTTTDLPVSVGAIVGDLDPAWKGTAESLAVAREIYRQPHVEPAIHTYSHPLDWEFFSGARAANTGSGGAGMTRRDVVGPDIVHAGYDQPRSYETQPFALTTEVDAAAAFVNRLLPAGRRVGLMQWSGDTRPFEAILARTRRQGLANINGGDTRFDREFPSAAWVSPLGVQIGRELQIYASNSNENTYTDLWRGRYFGFSFLTKTVENTGTPRRLKPFNLYYHMYSGERLSSLNAVRANVAYARSLPLAPIEASRFSRIVEGFFSTVVEAEGPRAWRVRDRRALQTLRFDATSDGVDFERSRGVAGQRRELGSLYVLLDEADEAPLVVLTTAGATAGARVPYLVESRWRVHGVRRSPGVVQFATEGYGPGEARWFWPYGTLAELAWHSASGQQGRVMLRRDADGLLSVRLPQLTAERVSVTITSADGRHVAD